MCQNTIFLILDKLSDNKINDHLKLVRQASKLVPIPQWCFKTAPAFKFLVIYLLVKAQALDLVHSSKHYRTYKISNSGVFQKICSGKPVSSFRDRTLCKRNQRIYTHSWNPWRDKAPFNNMLIPLRPAEYKGLIPSSWDIPGVQDRDRFHFQTET